MDSLIYVVGMIVAILPCVPGSHVFKQKPTSTQIELLVARWLVAIVVIGSIAIYILTELRQ